MKKSLFLVFTLALFIISCHQTINTSLILNLSFEDIEKGLPKNWYFYRQHSYMISLDSIYVKSGKYSIAIESKEDTVRFQSILIALPNNYDGEKITLSGYIKTENVNDGYAGLWMRIGPGIAFDNMHQNGVTGTTDWKKYEITLEMNPAQTKQIVLGGLLSGKGKMWLDDLKVSIDGKNIEKLQPYKPRLYPANNDKEFDDGSKIVFLVLNEQKLDELELLGRIWGYLKYYHPAVAKGNFNWDYELFRILPIYMKATDHHQRDRILEKWIKQYGRVSICKTCQTTPDSAFLKPDLSWIERSNINQQLKILLQNIYLNRNQGDHYYIQMQPSAGNPIFSNERTYETIDDLDTGFRLLALFRYWNMIHYFFPYKHLTNKDWNIVLKEYIPYFINAKNRLEYELTAARLIGEICDSHAMLMKGWNEIDLLKGSGQVLVWAQFIEKKLVVMEYYLFDNEKPKSAELKRGDIITHIEGKPIKAIVDSMKNYYSASNEATKMKNIANDILRSNKHSIHINYVSSGKIGQKKIYVGERDQWMYFKYRRKDTTLCYKFIDKNIGYITLKTIKNEDIPVIKKRFMNSQGIIIDIRNYPATFVPFLLGSYFVSNTTPFVKFTQGNTDNPGEFNFRSGREIFKSGKSYQGKLVVIVNEHTQSQAEFTAMAFHAGANTTIIGSQTAGADGNVSEIILPGGLETRISGIGVYYPDGRETQRIGIVPDIEIKPTIKGIMEGRDEVLEKAIEIIKQQ